MNAILLANLTDPNVNVPIVLPEMILAVTGIILMVFDSYKPNKIRITGCISMVGIVASAVALISLMGNSPTSAFNGMIVVDGLRLSFTLVFLLVTALTILISSVWVERENVPAGEYHTMLLFATVGMMFMASGNDLVIIFLGLETLSIATYVMAGMRRTDLRSNESAMKYFILGSYASGFLLYGMAMLYGATGTTNITEIAAKVSDANFPALLLVGAAMLVVGFGFKIAAAPFHVWAPDVYEGAPTPVTAFMAAGPKAAGFASFIRIFVIGFPLIAGIQASEYLHNSWVTALTIIAILTMTVGNVAAIVQNNIKRMLAYSSIAHAGYALVGFIGAGVAKSIAGRDEAISAVAFYMLTYAVTNLGAFAVITLLAQKNDRCTEFEDYNGIGFKTPVLAFTLSLFMLSLLGLPLTAGFVGKILIFRPALEAGSTMLTILVVAAVLNTAISAYYYLRLIVVMFFKEGAKDWLAPKIPAALSAVLIITVLGVFYLGLFGDGIIKTFSPPRSKYKLNSYFSLFIFVIPAIMKVLLYLFFIFLFATPAITQVVDEFNRPWEKTKNPLILDPYYQNKIDWDKLKTEKRVKAIIHKATEGLAFTDPKYNERKKIAKARNYKWGSYHLLHRGNPEAQADRYLKTIGKNNDELMALDIECVEETYCEKPHLKVKIEEIRKFLLRVKSKTNRYPILYANHSVTEKISSKFPNDKLFSKIGLWYARFKKHVTNFPKSIWKTYTVWQFASELNCAACIKKKNGKCVKRNCRLKQNRCPYTIKGIDLCVDINIYNGSTKDLEMNWAKIGN